MLCKEPGVKTNSDYYFATLSPLAKSLYFYLLCTGHFYCDRPYQVKRKNYNSYLLMYILSGECSISFRNRDYQARENDIVLLNCYETHTYLADKELEFIFIHFDGSMSSSFFDQIYSMNDAVFHLSEAASCSLKEQLLLIYNSYHKASYLPESDISCILQQILCSLIKPGSNSAGNSSSLGEQAMQYMNDHYSDDICLQDLASYFNINIYYFSHIFKKETGCSPYEYLLQTRINKAKKLLKSTDLSIKSISYQTGFHSESNFTYIFHKRAGMSPKHFRELPF